MRQCATGREGTGGGSRGGWRGGGGAPAPGRRRAPGRAAALGVAVLLWSAPAVALMPPYVYEDARREAANIIVIAVTSVRAPVGYGACTVSGMVKVVERGNSFRPGQAVAIGVPCSDGRAQPPLGGIIYQATDQLAASRFGRAWLNSQGEVVMSQYEQLPALP